MRQYLPYAVGGLGLVFIVMAMVLRNGTPDTSSVITGLSSMFFFAAGAICVIGGLVTFFLRDDETVW